MKIGKSQTDVAPCQPSSQTGLATNVSIRQNGTRFTEVAEHGVYGSYANPTQSNRVNDSAVRTEESAATAGRRAAEHARNAPDLGGVFRPNAPIKTLPSTTACTTSSPQRGVLLSRRTTRSLACSKLEIQKIPCAACGALRAGVDCQLCRRSTLQALLYFFE